MITSRRGFTIFLLMYVTILCCVSHTSWAANQQKVYSSPSNLNVSPGGAVAINVYYDTNNADATLTGIGLRIHWNSAKLSFQNLSGVLPTNLIGQQPPVPDILDFDQDPNTDTFILISWVDINGNWPGSIPIKLATLNFLASSAFSGATDVRFSSSSTAAGYTLDSTPAAISGSITHTLTVASINPASGVAITVSPSDNAGQGNGTTQFTRVYNSPTGVTLTAPATAGGHSFLKWQRNGADWATTPTMVVSMDADYTMTVVYQASITHTLTVASINPASGVAITVSPSDNAGQGNGTTQFTRVYNSPTGVTLTAPATAGGNNFLKWQRNGADWATIPMAIVSMDADYTMTAIYQGITPIAGPVDFDGDGKTDIAVYRQTTGAWYILKSSSNYSSAGALSLFWGNPALLDRPVTGDFDGDGKTDIGIYRATTGEWLILTSSSGYNPNNSLRFAWGNPSLNDQPIVGDFDGDGKADIAVYRPGSGQWLILKSSTGYSYATRLAIIWGNLLFNDTPLIGDFDGDGKTDLAIYRPTTGQWLILTSSAVYSYIDAISITWGNPGLNDQAIEGDFDGDAKADIAVYRPSSGQWFVLKSSTGYSQSSYLTATWGNSSLGDRPIHGDFDGDHKTDVAVFRPTSSAWIILKSSSGYNYANSQTIYWGDANLGDVPLGSPLPGANLQITFAPSSMAETSDGKRHFATLIQEVNGIGITLTKILVGGIEQSLESLARLGLNYIPPYGQLELDVVANPDGPLADLQWEFIGDEDQGLRGKTWHANLPTAP